MQQKRERERDFLRQPPVLQEVAATDSVNTTLCGEDAAERDKIAAEIFYSD